jgi:uncharacterized membrane protein
MTGPLGSDQDSSAPTPSGGPKETGRVEAFSDGVFAIAITLLVLDLRLPKSAELGARSLWPALAAQWPTFLAYLTSFATILVMWVNHHRMFNWIHRIDDIFLYLNGLLLLFVTFVPFPTSLIATYLTSPKGRSAAAIYAGTYEAVAIAFNLLWNHAARNGHLLGPKASAKQVRAITQQYRTGPILYVGALVLALFSAEASFAYCLLLAVYWSLTGSLAFFGREPVSRFDA